MTRATPISLPPIARLQQTRYFLSGRRLFASTHSQGKGAQNSRSGWTGRHGDDHAVKRDPLDVQADASQQGMKEHEQGTGGQATSRKDEVQNNKRAKEEFPEAPEPVIGMNSERGSVSAK